MRLVVKEMSGHKISVEIAETATVAELKTKIREGLFVVQDQQKLSFKGTRLTDDAAELSQLGLEDGAQVDIIVLSFTEVHFG
mmetsp:Transcript_113618/g.284335  ORF Transcript_113618/g.284335 Transcript_113618/m.284335 type:complete len:82 (-) Transcript_113618:91-336(-)